VKSRYTDDCRIPNMSNLIPPERHSYDPDDRDPREKQAWFPEDDLYMYKVV